MKITNFKNWKMLTKIMSISIVTIVLILSGVFFYIFPRAGGQIEHENMNSVQNVVDIAHSLMVEYNDRVNSGELTIEEAQKRAMTSIKKFRYQNENYVWINDLVPKMIMHPMKSQLDGKDLSGSKDPDGKYLFMEMVDVCKKNGGGFVNYMWPKPGKEKPVPKISYVKLFKPWGWIAGTGTYIDDLEKGISSLMRAMIIVLFICTIISLGLTYIIARKITGSLSQGVTFAKKVSAGDFTQHLDIDQKDEIGVLSAALNNIVSNLNQIFKDISAGVETLYSSSSQLSGIAQQMSTGAKQTSKKSNLVATAAEEMSTNMNSVAAAVEEASTNVGLVSTSAEEMTLVINEIAGNTEKARSITGEAVSEAKNASEEVCKLGKAAQEIGKITNTITEISEQTNLLALNATIEAARAGEAGKGFAVVANEIKELAKQTAEAISEIRSNIEGIQSSTDGTVTRIEQITKVTNEVNEIVNTIATAIEEQSATTKEIADNVGQASLGISEVTENIAQSSTVSEEIAKDIAEVNQASNEISNSSSHVNLNADELIKLAENLKEKVGQFKIQE